MSLLRTPSTVNQFPSACVIGRSLAYACFMETAVGKSEVLFLLLIELLVVTVHCLAAPDIVAGIKQPFDCLIVENLQAVQPVGEVEGFDIGRQHGRRFVLLRHNRRPQRMPYPIFVIRSGKVRHCTGP